jgi:MFS family permease
VLLAEENAAVGRREPFSIGMLLEILRGDPHFREYMFWMGLFGGGNLMLTSQLVVIFSEHLHLPAGLQIALLSVVPLGLLPVFVPFWARMFDEGHVVEYRARQSWALVVAVVIITFGTLFGWLPALWIGAVVLAFAYAGANLGWNLGHNDFASVGRAQHYMGVHVTLTGVRGAIAPPAGILIYQWIESLSPGSGVYSLVLPLLFVTVGAMGFSHMRRVMRAAP